MAYADELGTSAKNNAAILLSKMNSSGITNPYAQAAILSVVSKESEFNPAVKEISYATTSNSRIKNIFPKTRKLSDADLNKLKSNPKNFFDYVYASLGGSKYFGRGLNDITGIDNYRNIGNMIGKDLVNNPDLLTDPNIAADAAVAYFKNGINTLKSKGRLQTDYNAKDINDFKNTNDAIGAMYNVNAGAGFTKAQLQKDATGGKAKAEERVNSLFDLVKSGLKSEVSSSTYNTIALVYHSAKKNWMPLSLIGLGTVGIIVTSFLLIRGSFKK